MTDQKIHITAICGSLRDTSYTRMALNIALKGAAEMGATTHLIDLRQYELIFCESGLPEPPDVDRMRADTAKSHDATNWHPAAVAIP